MPKHWCFWTVVLEKTLESPLDCKEIKPVHPEGNQSWIFIGGTDAVAEALILWLPDAKNWLIEKDLDAGKDWRQEKKGTTEDEMVGWHHWLNGHEFEQALRIRGGQGSLVCCSPWGHKESNMTEQPNWLMSVVLGAIWKAVYVSPNKTLSLLSGILTECILTFLSFCFLSVNYSFILRQSVFLMPSGWFSQISFPRYSLQLPNILFELPNEFLTSVFAYTLYYSVYNFF